MPNFVDILKEDSKRGHICRVNLAIALSLPLAGRMLNTKHYFSLSEMAKIMNTTEEILMRVKSEIREDLVLVKDFIIINGIWYFKGETAILFRNGIEHLLDLKYS